MDETDWPPEFGDPPFKRLPVPMRCKACFYILDNLPENRCPECGLEFDPADATTFTYKPPFVWWTFWLPALLMSGVGGALVWLLLIPSFGFNVATTIVVPVSIGGVVGYGSGAKSWRVIGSGVSVLAVVGAVASIYWVGMVGVLCGLVLLAISLVPVVVGVVAGRVLRTLLSTSNFSQRDYLKSLFIQLMILLLPVGVALLEGRHDNMPAVAITTSGIVDAPPEETWRGIQFYEEVHRPVPWLLRLSPSLRPLYTVGKSERPCDVKTCVYEKGRLMKVITEAVPGRRLAFKVVEQKEIENHSIVLLDGSFDLEPVDGGRRTLVRLTTRYVPLLSPRFAYLPAEGLTVHALHGHVLAGMKDKAEAMHREQSASAERLK